MLRNTIILLIVIPVQVVLLVGSIRQHLRLVQLHFVLSLVTHIVLFAILFTRENLLLLLIYMLNVPWEALLFFYAKDLHSSGKRREGGGLSPVNLVEMYVR